MKYVVERKEVLSSGVEEVVAAKCPNVEEGSVEHTLAEGEWRISASLISVLTESRFTN